MVFLIALFVAVSCVHAATVDVTIGSLASGSPFCLSLFSHTSILFLQELISRHLVVSFVPTSVDITPGDSVRFVFLRPGDAGELFFGLLSLSFTRHADGALNVS